MADGKKQMTDGGWRMADGKKHMVKNHWRLPSATCYQSSAICRLQ
jgi:hypothetical protein